jgi:predicted amidophosphoribosyltransferase
MIRTARLVTRPVRYLAGLVLLHQCVLCRRFVENTGLCTACGNSLPPIGAPICERCGMSLGRTLADPICAACWMNPPPLAMIRAYLHYNDLSRKLILAFKNGDRLQLIPFLTSLMARDFAMITNGGESLVVPVPLHRQRCFRRRYNQSAD